MCLPDRGGAWVSLQVLEREPGLGQHPGNIFRGSLLALLPKPDIGKGEPFTE